jgi:diguanylate cyclase (GGDEF)-like protein/PAS domain S-box-containing protein
VTSTLDIDEVLKRIVEAGVLLTQADEGFIALLDEGSGQLYLRAVKNIDEDKSKTIRLPVIDTLVGSVLESQRPLRATQDDEGTPLKVSTGYLVYSILHVPIMSKGVPLGVLSVDNRSSKHEFDEADESVLSSLADYAAVAIENANLYQQAQGEITERRRVEAALRESQGRYALAVRGANDGLWDWDMKTNQVYYSPRWKSMLGYEEEEIGASTNEWFNRVHPEEIDQVKLNISAHVKGLTSHFESEYRMRHRDGTYRWMINRGIAVWDKDENVDRMAGSQTDNTARKQAEQELYQGAFYDALTGLPNRAFFMERLHHAVEHAKRRDDYLFAVLYLDIDRFKDVNDSLGHSMGDQLLIATSHLLKTALRPIDTVARLGGDEFVILLEDINDISDATIVADRVQNKLMTATLLPDHTLFVTASMGIVLSLTGYDIPEDVLRDADIAMYRAKANGRARYEIFDSTMRERIMRRLVLEAELRQALENDELRVFYQPISSIEDGKLIGFEALVRWQHPTRGILLPGEFIQLAEESGLIIPIDRFVLQEACRQIYEWKTLYASDPTLSVSVNFSSKEFAQPSLVDDVEQVVKETGLHEGDLKLEITESAFMENFDRTVDTINRLQELGVQIQIDDFGIGYSSLGYLSRFPLSALKIDQTFISRMDGENSYYKIVQAIVKLTRGLGLGVVAEGVETEEQLNNLKSLGCEYVQGAIVAMPMDGRIIQSKLTESAESMSNPFWVQAGLAGIPPE